jgi:hypothetical protein
MRLAVISVLLCLASILSSVPQAKAQYASAKFTSCKGCRLNHLPQVRKFFNEVVEKGEYPHVNVFYVHGKNPTLDLLDVDGKSLESMDVSVYKFDELHQLLQSKGFRPTGQEGASEHVAPDHAAEAPARSDEL